MQILVRPAKLHTLLYNLIQTNLSSLSLIHSLKMRVSFLTTLTAIMAAVQAAPAELEARQGTCRTALLASSCTGPTTCQLNPGVSSSCPSGSTAGPNHLRVQGSCQTSASCAIVVSIGMPCGHFEFETNEPLRFVAKLLHTVKGVSG